MRFSGQGRAMTEKGMQAALAIMELDATEMPLLWAVLEVESRGFGFLPDRRPKILFERHIFHEQTKTRFAEQAPDLSREVGGGYIGGAAEYERLERAIGLCDAAGLGAEPALRSASWGLGQVMGFNAASAGFESAAAMAAQMAMAEDVQLAAMARFIRSQRLHARLAARDWAGFARGYNGPGYWKHQYDVKLAAAHARFAAGVTRDLDVREAQAALLYLGHAPGAPDGVFGQNTRRALAAFRAARGLPPGEALDAPTREALRAAAGFG